MSLELLLIERKGCNRRVALDKDDLPAIHQGNQSLPPQCQAQMPQMQANRGEQLCPERAG